MSVKLTRLLRIIVLVQTRPGITAKELAERCETSERTIYRDIDDLSAANIPISSGGRGQGYSYISRFSTYPLDWTEQEAIAFSLLPSVLEQIKPLLPEGFQPAYEKVMATHHREKSKRADLLQDVADIIQMGTPAYRKEGSTFLYPIILAALSQQTLRTVYYTQSRGEQSERDIDPYYLVPREHRFYLIGYCHSAQAVRTFRVSRFREVQPLERTFDKSGFDLNTYLKHTWSIQSGDEQIRFKVKFAPGVAPYVLEEELFLRPRLAKTKDGGLLFEVTVNHDREFLGWLSQYGPDAEILQPASYRQVMRERLERWKQLYES